MKKKYLNELRNNGIIGEEDSVVDKRQKNYFPLVEPSISHLEEEKDFNYTDHSKMTNFRKTGVFDNFLQYSRISLPRYSKDIPQDWLVFEILGLAKCRIDLDHFTGCIADLLNQTEEIKFIDREGRRMSISDFVKEYEKTSVLRRYFRKRGIHSFHSKIFGDMKYIGETQEETCKKLSMTDVTVQFDTSAINDDDNKKMNIAEVVSSTTSMMNKDTMLAEIEEFFHDNPDTPWQPLPEHNLEQSPCYYIIEKDRFKSGQTYYRCKIHPEVWNINLVGIEHHCKYKDPDLHKSEVLRLIST
jgi:hypothetical protein